MLPEPHYTLVLLSGTRVQHLMVEKNVRKRSFVSVTG